MALEEQDIERVVEEVRKRILPLNPGDYRVKISDLVDAQRMELTQGDIFYVDSTRKIQRLGIGSAGQNLSVSSGIPAWSTLVPVVRRIHLCSWLANASEFVESVAGTYSTKTYDSNGLTLVKSVANSGAFSIVRVANVNIVPQLPSYACQFRVHDVPGVQAQDDVSITLGLFNAIGFGNSGSTTVRRVGFFFEYVNGVLTNVLRQPATGAG